ncbi:MAG: glycosyltransferase [Patescibacteria group bacterium]|mgnify:CR=1 FL=1
MENKKLKIAFLNIYQGMVGRGAETFIDELSTRLARNHDVKVIAGNHSAYPRWPLLWRFYLDPSGIMILLFTLRMVPKLIWQKYDIVVPTNGGWQTLIVRLLTWLTGKKMVISGQSGIGWFDRNNLWLFPDLFVATSTRALVWANKVNPFVNCVYIPNGVDLTKFNIDVIPRNINLPKPIILCVGALTKSKNIDLVIQAVAKVKNASLLVVGDGYMREEINFLGRNLLNHRFNLLTLPHSDMPQVYKAADVFVLTSSEREAFGIVYVEAMASNLPIVARDDDQRREIVGDAGVLVKDPHDINQLSLAIIKALDAHWDNKPKKQAQKFDWDKIAQQYEILFEEIRK